TTPDKYIGFAGNPIVLDFILGMIIAESEKLFGDNRFYNNKNTGYFYIVIINICLILWFTSAFGGNGITRSGIIAFFLVFSVVRIERIFSPSFPKIITIIGESSYSLYLIHIPVKEFADYYGNYFSFIPKQGTLALFFASISLSITLSVLIFNLIEKPINRFGHRLANKILPPRN
ncbi:acyltransferase family protein, partial [Salmonella enterica subsp. enterica serovar Montevideo]|nr:acyltransferase [Salmonella enterica subsp. enterica serovar Dublin]EBP2378154.1 acyltransferase [Salmonella enterica]EDH0581491.1 acyltransferase family protein [Salmonella enterica subsp. enterica serovar Montevideo]EDO3261929.1 acyltransferase [Salmonella enterica subsp. enterica serovar Montevideo]MCO9397548.1 acyltransferase family protein [Salmonella enterica subsp. enterica serovar Montevideo]